MQAAPGAGVARVVHCSSVAALGTHDAGEVPDETVRHSGRFGSVYEETKWQAQERVREMAAEGLPVVTVMPGSVYGVGDSSILGVMLRFYAKGWLVALPFQDAGVSWVRVEDVADGVADAHDKGRIGESYILGGDNATISELLRRLARSRGYARLASRSGSG